MNQIIPQQGLQTFDSGPLTPQKLIDDICLTFRTGVMRVLRLSTEDYKETWRPIENEMRHKLQHLAVLSSEYGKISIKINKDIMNPKILLYAFLYALGRMTYAVDDVATEIEKNLKDIPSKALFVMISEIRSHKLDEKLGMKMDEERWMKTLAAMEEEYYKRKAV